jgi:hypothetical protein
MRTVKEAAEANEIIHFKIMFFTEAVLGAKGTPAFKVGMRCTDLSGEELEGWLSTVVWGSQKSEYFTQKFLDSLSKETSISFDGDIWTYDEKTLKFSEGRCKLQLNAAGWPDITEWFKHPRIEEQQKEDNSSSKDSKDLIDNDIPF